MNAHHDPTLFKCGEYTLFKWSYIIYASDLFMWWHYLSHIILKGVSCSWPPVNLAWSYDIPPGCGVCELLVLIKWVWGHRFSNTGFKPESRESRELPRNRIGRKKSEDRCAPAGIFGKKNKFLHVVISLKFLSYIKENSFLYYCKGRCISQENCSGWEKVF